MPVYEHIEKLSACGRDSKESHQASTLTEQIIFAGFPNDMAGTNGLQSDGHGLVQKGRLDIYYSDKDGEGWKARKKVRDLTVCLYNGQPRNLSKATEI